MPEAQALQQRAPNAQSVRAFLARRLPDADVEVDGCEPMFGGWNSAMWKVTARLDREPRAFVLRGDLPIAKQVAMNDLAFECEVLEALDVAPESVAPAVRYFDADGSALGIPALVIDFVEGVSLQAAAFSAGAGEQEAMAAELARLAARIHAVPLDALPERLPRPPDWDSYVDERIEAFREVEAAWIERDPVLRYVTAWLDAHRPPPAPLTLVHGDFHTSNTMVLPDGRQIAVDWQFPHVGDPREDLGWTMIYESVAPPPLVTSRQEAFCAAYRDATGLPADVVNPSTLKWFALLALPRIIEAGRPASEGMVAGANTSLTLASGLALGLAHHRFYLDLVRAMEDA